MGGIRMKITIKNRLHRYERGQTIVFLVAVILGLLGILALVIDGGMAYAHRRSAQNAADAGALAGARELCEGNGTEAAKKQAIDFVELNNAEPEDPIVSGKNIRVTAQIDYDTFFARLFNQNKMTISATASAGCYVPCGGAGFMPIAWTCQPPIEGETPIGECGIKYGENNKYIIMDTKDNNADYICLNSDKECIDPFTGEETTGCLNCDFNNDGYPDLLGGGLKGWLDFYEGGGGNKELTRWVKDGYGSGGKDDQYPLIPYLWVGGESGGKTPGFDELANRVIDARINKNDRNIVVLPVFDKICEGYPPDKPGCGYDASTDTIYEGNSKYYYRIVSYSVFYIECVSLGKNDNIHIDDPSLDPKKHDWDKIMCPTKKKVMDDPTCTTPDCKDSVKTVEGYFITDYVEGMEGKCEGPGAGTYVIYLDN
jgi:Flp pilus assembly protein TadG